MVGFRRQFFHSSYNLTNIPIFLPPHNGNGEKIEIASPYNSYTCVAIFACQASPRNSGFPRNSVAGNYGAGGRNRIVCRGRGRPLLPRSRGVRRLRRIRRIASSRGKDENGDHRRIGHALQS